MGADLIAKSTGGSIRLTNSQTSRLTIRDIFCRVARAVGLEFTVPKANVVAVARRQHVATLDLNVAPKDRASQTLN
jgi:hypothetical protein